MGIEIILDNGVPVYKVHGEAGKRKLFETNKTLAATGTAPAVTQATNRATGVVIDALKGTITTHNASLAAEASAVFTVTNSHVKVGDVPVVVIRSGSVALNTSIEVKDVANGSFKITVINGNVAAGTAETGAIILNFVIL